MREAYDHHLSSYGSLHKIILAIVSRRCQGYCVMKGEREWEKLMSEGVKNHSCSVRNSDDQKTCVGMVIAAALPFLQHDPGLLLLLLLDVRHRIF
jgi:hypothetical protein